MLLLARHIPHEHLVAGLATALRAGALTADAVALEARKTAQADDGPPFSGPAGSGSGVSGTVTISSGAARWALPDWIAQAK
ncbi:hypothetical protein [Streptomyces sp. NPDC091377]|uniref:hypothetical protein n=1 Tax=Streptomyces sp. NPDC091377 TaxID=3365995 RepID=UPI00383ACF16